MQAGYTVKRYSGSFCQSLNVMIGISTFDYRMVANFWGYTQPFGIMRCFKLYSLHSGWMIGSAIISRKYAPQRFDSISTITWPGGDPSTMSWGECHPPGCHRYGNLAPGWLRKLVRWVVWNMCIYTYMHLINLCILIMYVCLYVWNVMEWKDWNGMQCSVMYVM